MNQRRARRLGIGAVLAGFLLVLIDASLPPGLSPYAYVLVLVLAGGIVLVGGLELLEWENTDGDWWQPTPTESGYRVSVPGDETSDVRASKRQARFRRRVVVSLMNEWGCSKSEANEHIAEGTWTDDRIAATYVRSGATPLPFVTRVRLRLRRTSSEELALRHTIRALRELRTAGETS